MKLRCGFYPSVTKGQPRQARAGRGMVRTVIVPAHEEIAVGTLRSILRQAGLGLEIFETL
ncbi:type II toxin-antitoxin system HicA family toxin [Meiothermus sp. CFH 77666]|nr:type II toxin-antitoxin system HicA family toxin [Meiothermus sp. CFH 77666]